MGLTSMKILVTGAGGLLGRALLTLLRNQGHDVYGLVREFPNERLSEVVYLKANLSENFDDILRRDIQVDLDCIVHLAQSSQFRDYPAGLSDLYSVNIQSTFKLLEYARKTGINQFILASTGGVYKAGPMPASENTNLEKLEALTPYLGSKLCAEVLSQNYTREFYITIIRPFFLTELNKNATCCCRGFMTGSKMENPYSLMGMRV